MAKINAAHPRRRAWMLAFAITGAAFAGALSYRQHSLASAQNSVTDGAYCDSGIGSARGSGSKGVATPEPAAAAPNNVAWSPKINESRPPEPAPSGMTWIPGGQFSMGTAMDHMSDARPWHPVYVDGYWMDTTEVTNEQFAAFVKAQDTETVAERKPRPEDYPNAQPDKLVAGSVVFSPPGHAVALGDHFQWWSYVPGANLGGIRKALVRTSRTV